VKFIEDRENQQEKGSHCHSQELQGDRHGPLPLRYDGSAKKIASSCDGPPAVGGPAQHPENPPAAPPEKSTFRSPK
jgi:hypothetical protein